MIRLVDLLKLQGVTLENENYKLRLATTGDGCLRWTPIWRGL